MNSRPLALPSHPHSHTHPHSRSSTSSRHSSSSSSTPSSFSSSSSSSSSGALWPAWLFRPLSLSVPLHHYLLWTILLLTLLLSVFRLFVLFSHSSASSLFLFTSSESSRSPVSHVHQGLFLQSEMPLTRVDVSQHASGDDESDYLDDVQVKEPQDWRVKYSSSLTASRAAEQQQKQVNKRNEQIRRPPRVSAGVLTSSFKRSGMNQLPLVPERILKPVELPYLMSEADVPPPFPLNGPALARNEERRALLSDNVLSVPMMDSASMGTVCSPGNRLCVTMHMTKNGEVALSVSQQGEPVLEQSISAISVNYKSCHFARSGNGGITTVHLRLYAGSSFWRPVPSAQNRHVYQDYISVIVQTVESEYRNCPVTLEIRIFDFSVAVRHLVSLPASEIVSIFQTGHQAVKKQYGIEVPSAVMFELEYVHVQHSFHMHIAASGDLTPPSCWANNMEEPYVKRHCRQITDTMTPITIERAVPSMSSRVLSVLQADGPTFIRSVVTAQDDYRMTVMSKGEIVLRPLEGGIGVLYFDAAMGLSQPTDWHMLLLASTAGELLERSSILPLLCPPANEQLPNMRDTRWIGHGKSLRERRFDKTDATNLTLEALNFAAQHNYQIVHFDAGWYGEESKSTSSALDVYPAFKDHLNMTVIGLHAAANNLRFTVYVNELALRDTPELARVYSQNWHIHGVKLGFVNTLVPRHMRVLAERIILFASHNLFVNIHDLYRPRGWSRTWPHLVTQEGVRGEERKPTAEHHTILAFVRLVQGAADYTPRYLKGSGLLCTRTHQLALPILLFSPIQSLFWAEPHSPISDAMDKWNPELIFWKILPTTWDDTRVLAGSIGEYAVIARRAGQEWFIGAITNLHSRSIFVDISKLFVDSTEHPRSLLLPPKRGYLMHVFNDETRNVAQYASNPNLIPQVGRQTFHIQPNCSSSLEIVDVLPGLPIESAAFVKFMQDQANARRAMWSAHDEWMRNEKHMKVAREGEYIPMHSCSFEIKFAPSGGVCMYITPLE